MGEIAEALKRSREEREASQSSAATSSDASTPSDAPAASDGPAAPSQAVPPGRSELLAALEAAKRADAETARPGASSRPGAERGAGAPRSAARPDAAPPIVEVHHALTQDALDSIGKVDMHRQLALQVATQLEIRSRRSLAVVSAMRDEGKTTVACTLAMSLASISPQRSVALVDLDMRKPSIARRLGLPQRRGVEQYLLGRAGLDDIRICLDEPMLDVYPSLEPQRSAHELLARPQLAKMLRDLEQRYATVIVDTPPTLVVPDSSLLLKQGPCCVTVARSGITRVKRFEEMLDLLPDDVVIGKVLNSASLPSRDKNYYEYSYHAEDESGDAKERPKSPSAKKK